MILKHVWPENCQTLIGVCFKVLYLICNLCIHTLLYLTYVIIYRKVGVYPEEMISNET